MELVDECAPPHDESTHWQGMAAATKMNKLLIALLLATAWLPPTAEAKEARCVIRQNGDVAYSGSCQFILDRGGSFSIRGIRTQPILPDVTDISVSIVSPGVAEVRGLTTSGINSRWGSAVRSTSDPACWRGSDFEICAY